MKRLFFISLVFSLLMACVVKASESAQVWLMSNPANTDTILTGDVGERDNLQKNHWVIDGTGRLLLKEEMGAVALHRLVYASPKGVLRLLSVDPAEMMASVKKGYLDEGLIGYVPNKDGNGVLTVYRLKKGDASVWTMSKQRLAALQQEGWIKQSSGFWLWTLLN